MDMRRVLVGAGLLVMACAGGPQAGPVRPLPVQPASVATPVPEIAMQTSPSPLAPGAGPATPADLRDEDATGAGLPAFACTDVQGPAGGRAAVTAVRVASHPAFDRLVIVFRDALPGYTITRQSSARFTLDASGQPAQLAGSAGALVRLYPATAFGSFSGPNSLQPGLPQLREIRLTGDFEAVNRWGLGLAGPPCLRAFTLGDPPRLVIDVQT